MNFRPIPVLGLLILAVAVPQIGIGVCGAIIVIQISLLGVRLISARWKRQHVSTRPSAPEPVFSVHVPTHNEPPGMVLQTLRSLLRQDWPADRYEIIVVDNNTSDPALWRPVEAYCAAAPGRVRFLHRTGVAGAKAGALNIALEHTRGDATHVVTVDADYTVSPSFLAIAADALARTGADFAQFPQAYSCSAETAAGVDAELEEYFRSNAQIADVAEAVLLTGTLCVISIDALKGAGGWSGATTTEDAECGVRLCNAGYSGRFINRVVGQGRLPFSLPDLERQRYRWCSGNFQTLVHHLPLLLGRGGALGAHKRMVMLSQLTAWFNFALVPVAVLLLGLFVRTESNTLMIIAALAVLASLADIVVRVTHRAWQGEMDWRTYSGALASRIALAPQSAKATLDALIGQELSFVVTDKSGSVDRADTFPPATHFVLFTAALLAMPAASAHGPLVLAAVAALMLPLPAAWETGQSLRAYRTEFDAPMEGVPA